MEVAARQHIVAEDERIVRRRIELRRHEPFGEGEPFADRAEYLRRAAQRIGVLHSGVIFAMRLPDFAVGEQVAQQGGGALLPGVRAGIMDAGIERIGRAADCLETHRPGGVRQCPTGIRECPRG